MSFFSIYISKSLILLSLCSSFKTAMVRTPSTPATSACKIARRTPVSTPGGPKSQEEKIFVTVRVRPLSLKEQALKDQVAWDCRDEHTIIPKGLNQERSSGSYNFGKSV